jgi:hypothetical protein
VHPPNSCHSHLSIKRHSTPRQTRPSTVRSRQVGHRPTFPTLRIAHAPQATQPPPTHTHTHQPAAVPTLAPLACVVRRPPAGAVDRVTRPTVLYCWPNPAPPHLRTNRYFGEAASLQPCVRATREKPPSGMPTVISASARRRLLHRCSFTMCFCCAPLFVCHCSDVRCVCTIRTVWGSAP